MGAPMSNVETNYRRWRTHAMPPFVRLGMSAHLFNWAAYLLAVRLFQKDDFGALLPTVGGLLVLIACLLFLMRYASFEPYLVITTVILNALVGLTLTWQVHGPLGYGTETGLTTGATIITTFFAFTIFRMPPFWAVVSFLPYGVLAGAYAVHDHRASNVGTVLLVGNLLLLALSFVTGLLVCCLLEYVGRRNFAAEQTIARQQTLIRRYVPPSVIEHIQAGSAEEVDAPQRRRITAFSSDVVGFTALADQLDPEALAEIVNAYVGDLAEIVDRHQGTVTEFAGDGLMAIFGAPADMEPADQVRAALAAAERLHRSLPEWSRKWYSLGITEPLRARVGINTGVVSVGTFGSSVRATYTGIGLQMNIAARVQGCAEPGSTLLTGTSWHLLNGETVCEPRGQATVKGVHFPIAMYEPRSPTTIDE